jgi:basic membrane protein A
VALVHGGIGAIQDLYVEGWNQADRELDFEGERVLSLIDDEEDMRNLAESGYGLIIDGMFDQGNVAYQLADEYPDVSFVVFDAPDTSFANVTVLHFVREGGAYLMGVAAALASETGTIGFIGGYQGATTESRRASYTAGARSINPDIVVESVYLGPYHEGNNGGYLDYDNAKSTAAEMYRSGIDVIHHSAGAAGLGIPAAAAELTEELGRELWVIGSEVDQQRVVPPEQGARFLTSLWKRRDQALVEAVRSYLAGELEPGFHELGLASRSVDFSRDGGLSEAQAATLDETRDSIIGGAIDPKVAQTEAPGWSLEPDMTGLFVFDGTGCSADFGPTQVVAGDVVRLDVINNSTVDVGLSFGHSEDGVGLADWALPVSTQTAPGQRNAVAKRLPPGTYVAVCSTDDRVLETVALYAVFETTCQGPPLESTDPAAVVEALAAATTSRNANALCSLFAEDARVSAPFFDEPLVGNAAIAEEMTPFDDDTWFQEFVITEIEVVDGFVIWSSEYRGLNATDAIEGHRIVVEDGKIILWEFGEFVED